MATAVLCNISSNQPVCTGILSCQNSIPIIIRLLDLTDCDIQSRVAVIISDLAAIGENKALIADEGGISALVKILDSQFEDVLVNAVEALRALCHDSPSNKTAVGQFGAIPPLVEFLSINSGQSIHPGYL